MFGMTDWRAVTVGFLVGVVAALFGLLLPGVGQAAAGLLAGFVAGYLADDGILGGVWHGLLAGALGAILLALLLVPLAALLASPFGPVASALGGAGTFVAVSALGLLFALDSAVAGAVGGLLA